VVFKEPTAIASTDVNKGRRIFTHIQSEVYTFVLSDDEAINIHRTMVDEFRTTNVRYREQAQVKQSRLSGYFPFDHERACDSHNR
jgi:hypothetical protein